MSAFDLLTIGSATRDIFVRSRVFEETPNAYAPDHFNVCLAMGAKIGVDKLVFTSGGGATNAAVTFQRFGLKTAVITRVGRDEAGDSIIDELRDIGIHTAAVQRDVERQTAHSIILLSGTGHRAVMNFRSASEHIELKPAPWKNLSARWIYLTSLGGNQTLLHKVFRQAAASGARVAWNPGNAELDLGLEKLGPWLDRTDVLILNREEAAHLTDLPARHLRKIMTRLSIYPDVALVVTAGEEGAFVLHERTLLYSPALKAERLNATGAGDAFGSAFVAALATGDSVDNALRCGLLNATNVVQHMGAKAGILKRYPSLAMLRRVHLQK